MSMEYPWRVPCAVCVFVCECVQWFVVEYGLESSILLMDQLRLCNSRLSKLTMGSLISNKISTKRCADEM